VLPRRGWAQGEARIISVMSTTTIELSEEERQIVLLALHKLGVARPGWKLEAIQPIERKLGGQMNWPEIDLIG
jgi:hypothetical protein